ncbi:cation diffusion facilitator family transporter [Paraburkholderia solisilvae]|uniref:Cation efflux protein transmembrane domain-containing protein n=1 Tax=Paraburkholderia solisilvae TaxID=624376 RepID=A0A6J5DLB4_9BURK|nr:cation transporter [Paraburkholderia solisilvae]CAB3753972.1 hypothetical protein LMG29739_01847 [Paraburkholderia solisilvae]
MREAGHGSRDGTARVIMASAVLNTILAIVQGSAGYAAHSSGLLADAVHAMTDIGVDVMLLAACWLCRLNVSSRSARKSDAIEHVTLSGVGMVLIAAGIDIALCTQDWQPVAGPQALVALGIAIFSLISRGLLYRWMAQQARRNDSPVLTAASWHVRADALSSLVATVGIASVWFGSSRLDAIAAVLIGLVIAYGGVRLSLRGMAGLLRRYRPVRLYFDAEPGPAMRPPVVAEVEQH